MPTVGVAAPDAEDAGATQRYSGGMTRMTDTARGATPRPGWPATVMGKRRSSRTTPLRQHATPLDPSEPPPTVSVIIPCHNYGHFLAGCVDSVLGQTGVDVSVLIVDDVSTDDSADVAERIAAQDPRVTLLRNTQNLGLIGTANVGLAWATGEFTLLLSSDDLLVPGALARAAGVMRANPNVGMVYGRPIMASQGRPMPTASGRWRGTDVWRGQEWLRLRCRTGHNCISSPEAVVRTAVQRAVGDYDSQCLHTSDLNMWLRIAAVSDIAYVRGIPQAIYRVHGDSMLRSQDGPLMDLDERRKAFAAFFADCPPHVADADALHAMATRALAQQALWQASRAVDRGEVCSPLPELVEFALRVHPGARRLAEWRGFRLRRRIGAGRSLLFLPFVATGVAHRLDLHLSQLRWRLRGI
jgi:hypothetical protein